MKQSEGLLLKPEILNGETATSVWDIITTKKLLETMKHYFSLCYHRTRDRTVEYVLTFILLRCTTLSFVNKTTTTTTAVGRTVGPFPLRRISYFKGVSDQDHQLSHVYIRPTEGNGLKQEDKCGSVQ